MKYLFGETGVSCHNVFTWDNISKYELISENKVSGFYHIIYIWDGSCRLHTLHDVNSAKKQTFTLHRGDICYIPPGVWYCTETPDGMYNTNIYFYYNCGCTPSFDPSSLPTLQLGGNSTPAICPSVEFSDMPILSDVFTVSDTFGGGNIVRQMKNEWEARYRYSSELLDRLTAVLLVETVRQKEFTQRPSSREAADCAISYIGEHYAEKIDCRTVAHALGYHPNYLNAVIKDATGMSLHRYITDTKIRRAVHLVNYTDMQINEIALALSFNDASHFTNVYTAMVGISPTKQRKAMRGEDVR